MISQHLHVIILTYKDTLTVRLLKTQTQYLIFKTHLVQYIKYLKQISGNQKTFYFNHFIKIIVH